MQQLAPGYLGDSLSQMQKLEVFEHVLNTTDGKDLANILWMRSDSSEIWLQRRTAYIRSLAVMSMVSQNKPNPE